MYPSALQLSPFSSTLFKSEVCIHKYNGNALTVEIAGENPILSLAEYRKLFNDYSTPDNLARDRINFLVRHARKTIKEELNKICQK